MSVPAQVLCEVVKADIVGLTLRARWAEGQTVIVLLHFLHLQPEKHKSDVCLRVKKNKKQLSSETPDTT